MAAFKCHVLPKKYVQLELLTTSLVVTKIIQHVVMQREAVILRMDIPYH